MADLRILPFKTRQKTRLMPAPPPLNSAPTCIAVFGPVRSGKTLAVSSIAARFYKFPYIVILSPSGHTDASLEPLRELGALVFDNPGDFDAVVRELVEHQKDQLEEEREHILIVVDDSLGVLQPNSEVARLSSRFRHFMISLIYTAQLYRQLPPVVRINAESFLLFRTHNGKEIAKIEEEFSGAYGADFIQKYRAATSEKHSFIFINQKTGELFQNLTQKVGINV